MDDTSRQTSSSPSPATTTRAIVIAMHIAVIGTKYVGLVTGAGFAELGHGVTCVDLDATRIEMSARGEVAVLRARARGARHPQRAARPAALHAIDRRGGCRCPRRVHRGRNSHRDHGTGRPLVGLRGAARQIGRALSGPTVVVTKSTVPIGTSDQVHAFLAEVAGWPFAVASNPEFLKEGEAVDDFMNPARVIIAPTMGSRSRACASSTAQRGGARSHPDHGSSIRRARQSTRRTRCSRPGSRS